VGVPVHDEVEFGALAGQPAGAEAGILGDAQVHQGDDHVRLSPQLGQVAPGGGHLVGDGEIADVARQRQGAGFGGGEAEDRHGEAGEAADKKRFHQRLAVGGEDVGGEKREARRRLLLHEHRAGGVELVVAQRHGVVADGVVADEIRFAQKQVRLGTALVHVAGVQDQHVGVAAADPVDQRQPGGEPAGAGAAGQVVLEGMSVVVVGVQDDQLGFGRRRGRWRRRRLAGAARGERQRDGQDEDQWDQGRLGTAGRTDTVTVHGAPL